MADLLELIFRGRPKPTDKPAPSEAAVPLGPPTRASALASGLGVPPSDPALTLPPIGGRTTDAQMQAEGRNMIDIQDKIGDVPGWKELKLLSEAEAFERAVTLAERNPDGFIAGAEKLGGPKLGAALSEVLGAYDWPDMHRAAVDLVKERLGPYGVLGVIATGEPAAKEST